MGKAVSNADGQPLSFPPTTVAPIGSGAGCPTKFLPWADGAGPAQMSWWVKPGAMLGGRTIPNIPQGTREASPVGLSEPRGPWRAKAEATDSYGRAAGPVTEQGWSWGICHCGWDLPTTLLQSLRTRVLEGPMVPGMMGRVGQHPRVASDRKAVQTGLAKRGHESKPQKADPTWGTHGPWGVNFIGHHPPLLSVSPRGWPRSPPATGGLLWVWGDHG